MSDERKTRMEQWVERMRQLQKGGDAERDHAEADDILVEALLYLGCDRLVEEWAKVDKWYA